MLRISLERTPRSERLKLEGRLTGPWVHELEQAWARISFTALVVEVDLNDVSFIDEDGKVLLNRIWQQGARLLAKGCCTGHIIKEITGAAPDIRDQRDRF
jgi:ABC-type transporter Mla MlaB component